MALDQLEPTVLSGISRGRGHEASFLSPDGQCGRILPTKRRYEESGDYRRAPPVTVLTTVAHPVVRPGARTGRIIFATTSSGDRPAARLGCRRRADGAHEA